MCLVVGARGRGQGSRGVHCGQNGTRKRRWCGGAFAPRATGQETCIAFGILQKQTRTKTGRASRSAEREVGRGEGCAGWHETWARMVSEQGVTGNVQLQPNRTKYRATHTAETACLVRFSEFSGEETGWIPAVSCLCILQYQHRKNDQSSRSSPFWRPEIPFMYVLYSASFDQVNGVHCQPLAAVLDAAA